MMKKKYIFLLVLVAAFAGFYYLTPSFESIVKQVVHKYGSAVTGTDVNLEGFNLKLADGEGHIGKITVGNPKNYKPVINYEILSLTQNNLSQLLENIKKNTASAEKAEQKEVKAQEKQTSSAEKDSGGKKVIIKKLVVRGGEISVAASAAADITKTTAKLPEITLTNIGEDKKGASVAETVSKVLTKILNTAYKTIVDSKIADLKNVAEENLNNVVGGVKERIKEIGIFGK